MKASLLRVVTLEHLVGAQIRAGHSCAFMFGFLFRRVEGITNSTRQTLWPDLLIDSGTRFYWFNAFLWPVLRYAKSPQFPEREHPKAFPDHWREPQGSSWSGFCIETSHDIPLPRLGPRLRLFLHSSTPFMGQCLTRFDVLGIRKVHPTPRPIISFPSNRHVQKTAKAPRNDGFTMMQSSSVSGVGRAT
jgi:hypothetical protein